MSQITTNLGYGKQAIVEMDVFTRIMKGEFWDDEEVRYLRPLNYRNSFAYVGLAPSGSSVLDPVWSCVRRSYDANGKCYRDQFQSNIPWVEVENNWI